MIWGILLVAAGIALGIWFWPQVAERRRQAQAAAAPDMNLMDMLDAPGSRKSIDRSPVDPACTPLGWDGVSEEERHALRGLLNRIDLGLAADDPALWPDAAREDACWTEATAILDEAEAVVELESRFGEGGPAVHDSVSRAIDLLLELAGRDGEGARVRSRLGLSRAVWIRSRCSEHHYRREGLAFAAKVANDALGAAPGDHAAQLMVARVQVGLGKLDRARTQLIELMAHAPDDGETLRTRSRWLWAHGDSRGAMNASFDVLDALEPGPALAERVRIGPQLIRARRWDDAAATYEALIEWREDHGAIWQGYARALLEKKRWDEARSAAERAVQLLPVQESRDVLREVMVRQGRGDEASET